MEPTRTAATSSFPTGRPHCHDLRELINGIRHRIRVGCPWRDAPSRYGPWWRIYALFRTWQLAGVWAQIEAQLQSQADAQDKSGGDVSVDSTTARAHIHAAGAWRDSPQRIDGEPANHVIWPVTNTYSWYRSP